MYSVADIEGVFLAENDNPVSASFPVPSMSIPSSFSSRTDALKELCEISYSIYSDAHRRYIAVETRNIELTEKRMILRRAKMPTNTTTKEIAANRKQLSQLEKLMAVHIGKLHEHYPLYAASSIFDYQTPHLAGRYGESDEPCFQIHRIPITLLPTKLVQIGTFRLKFPNIAFLPEKDCKIKLMVMNANGLKMPDLHFDIGNYGGQKLIGVLNHATNYVACLLLGNKFNDYFRKVNYYVWCAHDADRIKRFCRERNHLIPQLIYRYNRFRLVIRKAIINKEDQIIPAILFFGKGASELKEGLGSYLWKRIVKSSPTRNSLIFSNLMILLNRGFFEEKKRYGVRVTKGTGRLQHLNICDFKDTLALLYEFPSSLLKTSFFYHYEYLRNEVDIKTYLQSGIWAIANGSYTVASLEQMVKDVRFDSYMLSTKKSRVARITYLKGQVIQDLSRLFIDTWKMAVNLDRPFNPEWSSRRMHREHEIFTREGLKATMEDRQLNFRKQWPKSITVGCVQATLLDTTHDLLLEGSQMRHCVGSYINTVDSGNSIIYSLKTEQDNVIFRSTLQLAVGQNKVSPVQNRSMYNDLPIQLLIDAAIQVASVLNQWLLKKELLFTHDTQ